MLSRLDYPRDLHKLVGDSVCLSEDSNRMGGSIRELRISQGSHFFLKQAQNQSSKSLHDEYTRLIWLSGKLPVPEVVYSGNDESYTYLLLSALPGKPAHRAEPSEMKKTLETVATALRAIHAIDISHCPFVNTLSIELQEAKIALTDGTIAHERFIANNSGVSPSETLDHLRKGQSDFRETTFTHGDFCLPNTIVGIDGRYGIVDWATCGVADPFRDFSAIDGSIRRNFGESYIEYFFDAYGLKKSDLNLEKIDYYKTLDLFFRHQRQSG